MFYGSVEDFLAALDVTPPAGRITIDVSHAHVRDISAVAALETATETFRPLGAEVRLFGLNADSERLLARLARPVQPRTRRSPSRDSSGATLP